MKNLVLSLLVMFFVQSCAHHDTKPAVDHHHHETKETSYDGKCAYSVAHNQLDVAGKPEFSFKHGGMTYYFSSEEKMTLFRKDLDKNINVANQRWETRGGLKH